MPSQPPHEPPDRRIWLDGAFVPWERATVHVLSHSLQRGSLIFDYMRICSTQKGWAVFRLPDHVERFFLSAELVGLPLPLKSKAIEAAILETVRANPGATAVKISAYLPSVEVDVVPMDDRVSIAIAAYDPRCDIVERTPGCYHSPAALSLWIEKGRHNRRRDIVDPKAKVAANYLSPMAAKWAARRAGYDDILLLDEDGCIAEGPTTNLFLFDQRGVLCTPPERNVLLGVTRRSILDIAKHDGLEVIESPVLPEELLAASEVFLTGTTSGVSPVVKIDGRVIGSGVAGPSTTALHERFEKISSGADPAFENWLCYVDEP